MLLLCRGQLLAIVHKKIGVSKTCGISLTTDETLPYPISLPTGKCNAEK